MVRMAVNNSLASSSVNSEEVSGSTRERYEVLSSQPYA